MTLATVLDTIQTAMSGLSGVQDAPDYPPESIGDFPFVVTYPETYRGEQNSPDDFRMLYDIRVELHVGRKDLPEDVIILYTYPEIGANALFKALRNNLIAHNGLEGSFGALTWNQIDTIGWVWVIQDVKVLTTIT